MLTPQEELQAQVLRMYGTREGELKRLGSAFVEAARDAAKKTVDQKVAEIDADIEALQMYGNVFELMAYSKKVT